MSKFDRLKSFIVEMEESISRQFISNKGKCLKDRRPQKIVYIVNIYIFRPTINFQYTRGKEKILRTYRNKNKNRMTIMLTSQSSSKK